MIERPLPIGGKLVRSDRCGVCKHYNPSPKHPLGECRRFPPTVSAVMLSGKLQFATEHPRVDPDTGYCGEWRAKITVG